MSKASDDQSNNHDVIRHNHSYNNALNGYDLLQACGGGLPTRPISNNRIQALTNNMTAAAAVPVPGATVKATMQGASEHPPAPINGKTKKKPRNKKKRKATLEQNEQPADSTTQEDATTGRPGKNRLRKMRYLQSLAADSSSPSIDHLLYCAECCCFTQSVSLEAPPDDGKTTTTTDIRVQPLIVLDLNGILCHRIRKTKMTHHHYYNYRPVAFDIANTPVIARTDIATFLRYMDQHFCLAVWTSAKNKTAKAMVQQLFPSDIASRLLFIWDQQHCDATSTNNTNTNDNQKANKKNHHHDDDVVFVKDLAKVWKQYPLWNDNNTILMDDSRDKCTQWHANAVHPPPLHGLVKDQTATVVAASTVGEQQQQQQDHHHLMSDEENERLQQMFFERLVHYWQSHCMTITFDEDECCEVKTSTKVVKKQQQGCPSLLAAEPGEPSNNITHDYSTRNNGLVEFLKIHAVGHMGWE